MFRRQLHHLIDQVADSVPSADGFGDVDAMDGAEYEQYCAHILTTGGWHARVSPQGADQGIDIYAEKDGIKLVVQTKKYANSVGNAAVQQIVAGRVYAGADYAAVVSPAPFTKSAQELAATANVVLLHHDQLRSLAFQTRGPRA